MSEVEITEDPPIWKRRRVQIIAAAVLVIIIA